MNKNFLPSDFDGKLGRLVEESGEVLAAIGKIQRWGLFSYNPLLPVEEREENWEWLQRELKDLEHAIDQVKPYLKPQIKAPPQSRFVDDDPEWDPQP